MKNHVSWMMLALFLGFIAATSVYGADQPAAGSSKVEIPGNIPQTGDEALAKRDAEVMRGKLLKIDDRLYTVETAPGSQVSMRAGSATKFDSDYKGVEGDWIEALVTPDMHIQSLKKAPPAYTVEGSVLRVDGDFLVLKDTSGKETRLQTSRDTKMEGSHKVGERIRAEYAPDGRVLSVKPAKIQRGPEGG